MAFRASIHGWPFPNAFSCPPSGLGIGAPPLPDLGLGGGMCWTALDRYLDGISIARSTRPPEEGDSLHTELIRRQVAAVAGIWPRVREWQARPAATRWDAIPGLLPLPGGSLASLSRSEWRAIRKRLDDGRPVLLTLLADSDVYSAPRSAWQVLATGYTRESGRIRVSVYDPGSPDDDEVRLGFATSGPLNAHLTGGRAVRGFFRIPYDRSPSPALRAESFADPSVIGLNRTVTGAVVGVAGRDRLDLVARGEGGALLHFRRERRGAWEGANVTERHDLGSFQLRGDPAAVRVGRALHVFGRSREGDLLHFRLGRTWKARNRSHDRRGGPRCHLSGPPVPVVGRRRHLSVLGRDMEGGLVHYFGSPFGRWVAEQVAGDPLESQPFAVWLADVLHVVGVASGGRLVHWRRDGDNWTTTDVSASGDGPAIWFDGAPEVLVAEGRLHVFGRDPDGRLILAEPGPDATWRRSILAGGLSGRPAPTTGPGGLHVFAPSAGGLLHAWKARDWRSEDLLATRPALAGPAVPTGPLYGWGSEGELRVFGRRGGKLVVFTWTPGGDWTAAPLADRAGIAPGQSPAADTALLVDGRGNPHLFGTDGRGTIVHVEHGPWVEPGREARTASRVPASDGTVGRKKRRRARSGVPTAPARVDAPAPAPEPATETPEGPAVPVAMVEPAGPALEPARDHVFDPPGDEGRLQDLAVDLRPEPDAEEPVAEEPVAEEPGAEEPGAEQFAGERPVPRELDPVASPAAGAPHPVGGDADAAPPPDEDDGLLVLDDDGLFVLDDDVDGPAAGEEQPAGPDPGSGVDADDPLPLLEEPVGSGEARDDRQGHGDGDRRSDLERPGEREASVELPNLEFGGDEATPRYPVQPDLGPPVEGAGPSDAQTPGEAEAGEAAGGDGSSGAEEAGGPAEAAEETGVPTGEEAPDLEEIDLSTLANWPPPSPALRRRGRDKGSDKRREAS